MKQQIIAIHGGDAFPTYERYLAFLRNFQMEFEKLNTKGWKNNLNDVLGEDYEVVLPKMPNSFNSRYLEWKIWFEKFFPIVRDNVILIGHSLGGSFLAKYLSEEDFSKKIKTTFLVAAPYDIDGDQALVEFVPPDSLEKLAAQGGEIHLYHSKDDPVVAFFELKKYQDRLPNAKTTIFEDRGHFNQEEFPEIVAEIKKLTSQ